MENYLCQRFYIFYPCVKSRLTYEMIRKSAKLSPKTSFWLKGVHEDWKVLLCEPISEYMRALLSPDEIALVRTAKENRRDTIIDYDVQVLAVT